MSDAAQALPASGGPDDALLEAAVTLATAAAMPLLLVNLASRRVVAVSDAFVELIGVRREAIVGSDVTSQLVGGPNPAAALLATGSIDGYETTRPIRVAGRRPATVHVWAHAFDDDRPPRIALIVVSQTDTPPWTESDWAPAHHPVLGSVDADWRVERVTCDAVDLLGYAPLDLVGRPFLGAVHPSDLGGLLTAVGQARRSGRSATIRLRLHGGDDTWRWCRAYVAPMDESPGFAFMLMPLAAAAPADDVTQEVEQRLSRISHEMREALSLYRVAALPNAEEMPELSALTAREWQIVSALRAGSQSADIATSLNLAPSTVRNHLTSIYRKMGVSSQVGLLAMVNRAATTEST